MGNTETDNKELMGKFISGLQKAMFGKFDNLSTDLTNEQKDEILILDSACVILKSLGCIYTVAYSEEFNEFYLKHIDGDVASLKQIEIAKLYARRFIDD
jgi:hypothetical protein